MEDGFEREYKKEECYWGLEPASCVKEILNFKKAGIVLDLGVGEGRNALFLAQNGFQVTGVDSSATGIKKFLALAKKSEVEVEGIVKDIRSFVFTKSYDVILSNATLHFLRKQEIDALVRRMKRSTKSGGLNVVSVFTKDNPFKGFSHLFERNELRDLYKEWDVLTYQEYLTPWEKHGKDGELHRHAVAILITQKP